MLENIQLLQPFGAISSNSFNFLEKPPQTVGGINLQVVPLRGRHCFFPLIACRIGAFPLPAKKSKVVDIKKFQGSAFKRINRIGTDPCQRPGFSAA
ncbi:hypothetical protein MHM88_02720 [Epibacterium sp. MM17-32]|uniref:hypothetical protein n=1 Tax=Epibacterium sp. MM17-32 TaxID=2917734 RepID=UPI001EF47824|nr:hypothetical protein [Epibacterium sp. MM17-32]MCG7626702.1 hypothetical protein [Epibacterium sp. MM17-32]